MQKSPIEWTDYTSNPIRAYLRSDPAKHGWHCEKVSAGCANCYAERINRGRFGIGTPFTPESRKKVELFLNRKEIEKLRTFKPKGPFKSDGDRAMVFVCDMTDWMLGVKDSDSPEEVRYETVVRLSWIHELLKLFEERRDIIWQTLTKRPARQRAIMQDYGRSIPNWWAGVSVEDQESANQRMPELLGTGGPGVRFVSYEPALGPVDMNRITRQLSTGGVVCGPVLPSTHPPMFGHGNLNPEGRGIDWVIAGGESGPRARLHDLAWPRSVRDQCAAAGVPFFFKQTGARYHENLLMAEGQEMRDRGQVKLTLRGKHGGELEGIPADLRVRQWPMSG